MEYPSIKNWAEEDRPREKALLKRCYALTETKLIATTLGSGTQNTSAIDLAKKIFALAHNDLNELGKFSLDQFKQIKGIGDAKAISLLAAFELGRRRNSAEIKQKKSICSSSDIFQLMYPRIGDIKHEEFWAIYLNNKKIISGEKQISSGGITRTVVDTKIIARHAISLVATGLVVSHNHPAENKNPSPEDIRLTKQIAETMKLIDCRFLDHVIISGNDYYSFCDEGVL